MPYNLLNWVQRTIALRPANEAERLVSVALKNSFYGKYYVLNNLFLPSEGNTTNTQIDHVLISEFGVFCIETKGHKGYIFGKARQEHQWTQCLPGARYRLNNPFRQNYAHTQALHRVISQSLLFDPTITSLVAFPNATLIKCEDSDAVGGINDIISKIRSYNHKVLTNFECDAIYYLLRDSSKLGQAAIDNHKNEIVTLYPRH